LVVRDCGCQRCLVPGSGGQESRAYAWSLVVIVTSCVLPVPVSDLRAEHIDPFCNAQNGVRRRRRTRLRCERAVTMTIEWFDY
jgi:hypothetical protein